ncbi:hypothetical protein LPJ66_000612 [Kickxella alabastrina]|uniref:Uncharacterized protein n=1 Tax=Kickxella alabastrina TaxID=61397 RepID=A0ACC1IVF7_9FUNG|nr:hypothetical protein LPJ66_000612 [Kickxella alabastrina]
MGRKKISISEIENSRQRTVTFARRRAGLIKKAHELSVLCGVKVAIVIFDAKNASHVYASSGAPEDLFARYLNKQFLTNESRKRKEQAETVEEETGGTYGFDDTGSFIRRRLAVVNEYKVTSDGPSSENLHVKYTKQYHNPNTQNKPTTDSPNQPSTTSTSIKHPNPLLDCNTNPATIPGMIKTPLPVRSISLVKRGTASVAPNSSPGMAQMPFQQAGQGRVMSAIDSIAHLGMQHQHQQQQHSQFSGSAELMSAGDLSSLGLLSHHGMGSRPPVNMTFDSQPIDLQCVRSMLGIIDNKVCDGGSPISMSGSSNGSNVSFNVRNSVNSPMIRTDTTGGGERGGEPKAKRPKSQSFSHHNFQTPLPQTPGIIGSASNQSFAAIPPPRKPSAPSDFNESLLDNFFANPELAELLQRNWQGNSSSSSGGSNGEQQQVESRAAAATNSHQSSWIHPHMEFTAQAVGNTLGGSYDSAANRSSMDSGNTRMEYDDAVIDDDEHMDSSSESSSSDTDIDIDCGSEDDQSNDLPKQNLPATMAAEASAPMQQFYAPAAGNSNPMGMPESNEDYARLCASIELQTLASASVAGPAANVPVLYRADNAMSQGAFDFASLNSIPGAYLSNGNYMMLQGQDTNNHQYANQQCGFPPDMSFAIQDGKVF